VAVFKIEKVIGAVPTTISPDCIYLVRTGAGFDLFASDVTGSIAHALNGGTGSTDLSALLSLPVAQPDVFEYAIVIQNGELRRMAYDDFVASVQPDFDPAPDGTVYHNNYPALVDNDYVLYNVYALVDRLVYDDSHCSYDGDIFVYPGNEVLVYGNDILYFGEEELIFDVDGPYVKAGYVAKIYIEDDYMEDGYFVEGYVKESIV